MLELVTLVSMKGKVLACWMLSRPSKVASKVIRTLNNLTIWYASAKSSKDLRRPQSRNSERFCHFCSFRFRFAFDVFL